jgi:hypothetical protein
LPPVASTTSDESTISTLGLARARSTMICDARNLSLRWTKYTLLAYLAASRRQQQTTAADDNSRRPQQNGRWK